VICKSVFANHPSTSHEFCSSPHPPSVSLPLDHHHVARIEVSIVAQRGWFPPDMFLTTIGVSLTSQLQLASLSS
jgi:hypothetical protein